MNKLRILLPFFFGLVALSSCKNNNLVDSNSSLADNKWAYTAPLRENVEIKDANQPFEVYFKLRHTVAYRYSNMYVFVRIKGNGFKRSTRYQFKLAKLDGQWLGKGSGDLYSFNFPLLTDFRFPKAGKYQIEIEQNMRDNPLIGVSDIGLTVSPTNSK